MRLIKTFLYSAIITIVMAISGAEAQAAVKSSSPEIQKKIEQNTDRQLTEKQQKIMAEATHALDETRGALRLLDAGKKTEALKALERATGKLELIVAREPKLALAPADTALITHDVIGDAESIKKIRKQAEDAIEDGRLQEARHLIEDLGSETVISVTNLPLASYPEAIKKAARLIDENKLDEAKDTLRVALNTLVVTNTIIPLPVVAAEELLKEAEKLAEKKSRSSDENKKLSQTLDDARKELKLAQEFGYGTKKDFKNLYDQIKEIEKKTDGGKSGTGFFNKIKASIEDLMKSIQLSNEKTQTTTRSG